MVTWLLTPAAARAEAAGRTGERFRIFRAEKTYAVRAGRWYFEFEAVTAGDMRVGWSRPGCQPDQELGSDERAFAFDGLKVSAHRAPHPARTLRPPPSQSLRGGGGGASHGHLPEHELGKEFITPQMQ